MPDNLITEIVQHLKRLLPLPRHQLTTHEGRLLDSFVKHLDAIVAVHNGDMDGETKHIVYARYSEGRTARDIADEMRCSTRAVYRRLEKALEGVAETMGEAAIRDLLATEATFGRSGARMFRYGVPCLRKGAGSICRNESWHRDLDKGDNDWVCTQCSNRVRAD